MLTIDNLFLSPLPKFNKHTHIKKENDRELVEYSYNSLGYRSSEPELYNQSFILALGCSHTEGTGQHNTETWTYKLSQLLNQPVANFGQGGAGAEFIELISYKWILKYNLPTLVIIQWPNPIRELSWDQHIGQFRNINSLDNIFKEKLNAGELNFYAPWIKSINLVNLLWKAKGIPVLHCYFDILSPNFEQYIIPKIHSNDINNDRPWLFDSKGHDLSHHSDQCTTQWANRISDLLTIDNFSV